MVYVAFLRGVNVGGKGIVSMAAIKEALVGLGLSDVRTYINSGNVIFSTRASEALRLTARIEKALELHTGMAIKVLVMDHKSARHADRCDPEGAPFSSCHDETENPGCDREEETENASDECEQSEHQVSGVLRTVCGCGWRRNQFEFEVRPQLRCEKCEARKQG